jgi:hypothetical protein
MAIIMKVFAWFLIGLDWPLWSRKITIYF